MSKADGTYRVEVIVDSDNFERKLDSLAATGAKALGAMTASIAAVSGAIVNVGKDFETSFAKASTMFGDVAVQTDTLKSKIIQLSNETGQSATVLNEALYSALSAGVEVTEDMSSSMKFLETNSKLAKAGFTDVDTAVQATAKVLNAYGMEVSEIDKVANILINTQNKGITTVAELSSVLAQVTPTAAAMNVSFEQVAASLAVMTAQGTPTAQATTQLNQLFAELGKSGTQAAKNLQKAAEGTEYAGKSFNELMETGVQLNAILALMQNYANDNNLSMIDMFSSIEAGKAALSISNDAQKFNEDLKSMTGDVDTLDKAYESMMNTLDSQLERVKEQFKNIGISAYEDMQDPLKEAARSAADALQELANNPQFKQGMKDMGKVVAETAVSFIEIGRELLPLLSQSLSFAAGHMDELTTAVKAFGTVYAGYKIGKFSNDTIKSLQKAVKVVDKAKESFKEFEIPLKALTPSGTIGLAIAGITALSVGFAKYKLSQDEVAQSLLDFNDSMDEFNHRMRDSDMLVQNNIDGMAGEITSLNSVASAVKSLVDENGNLIASKDEIVTKVDALNKALGEEALFYDETSGKIVDQKGQVVELTSAVNDLINAKKAQIWIDANEGAYTEALKIQQDALSGIEEKLKLINELKNKQYGNGSFEELSSQYAGMKEAVQNGTLLQEELNKWGAKNAEFLTDVGSLGALENQISQLDNVAKAQDTIIKNYETMLGAVESGDLNTQKALLAGLDASAIQDSAESIEALKAKIEDLKTAKENLANSGLESDYVQNQIDLYQDAINEQNALLQQMYDEQKVNFSQSGTDSAQAWSDSMNSKADEGMGRLTSNVQSKWNQFSLSDKRARITVDIVSNGGGPAVGYGGTSRSAYELPHDPLAVALFNSPEPISVLNSLVDTRDVYNNSSDYAPINAARSIAPYAAQMVDNRTIELKQTNNFNVPIERPSDVTRALERQNRNLAKQF